jgi:amino acid transporter
MLFVIIPPPGKAYEFLINLSGYPQWIFYGLSVVALLVLRKTHSTIPRPFKSLQICNIIFILVCVLLAIVPFIPPNTPVEGPPYFLVPLIGVLLIAAISVIWYMYAVVFKHMDLAPNEDVFEKARLIMEREKLERNGDII